MRIPEAEHNKDRVYDSFDTSSIGQRCTREGLGEWYHLGKNFLLDRAPWKATYFGHHFDATAIFNPSTKVFVSLTDPDTSNVIYPPYWQRGQSSSSPREEHELRALAIAEDIYELSGKNDDISLLRACFGAIESAFSRADVEVVDALLETLDTSKVPSIASLGIARATARARHCLPHWTSYVVKLKNHLSAQGEVVSQTMRGLLTKDDQLAFPARRLTL